MQSIALRKILEAFRILLIATIKIEAKLFSTDLRDKQNLIKRTLKIKVLTIKNSIFDSKRYSLCSKISKED